MEIYTVTVDEFEPDGDIYDDLDQKVCLRECWRNAQGLIHRELGPAVTLRDVETKGIVAEFWYAAGRLHREHGPAVEKVWRGSFLHQSGNEPTHIHQEWWQNGALHREDGPARLTRGGDFLEIFEWHLNGVEHRVGAPSYRAREGSVIESERWTVNGQHHREDGPALQFRDVATGVSVTETWYRNGLVHRIGGPADLGRDPQSGRLTGEGFFKFGVEVEAEEVGATRLLTRSP